MGKITILLSTQEMYESARTHACVTPRKELLEADGQLSQELIQKLLSMGNDADPNADMIHLLRLEDGDPVERQCWCKGDCEIPGEQAKVLEIAPGLVFSMFGGTPRPIPLISI